jgi:hypothetical protein
VAAEHHVPTADRVVNHRIVDSVCGRRSRRSSHRDEEKRRQNLQSSMHFGTPVRNLSRATFERCRGAAMAGLPEKPKN